ncbi:MAG: glycosyltransferase family A protein [Halioglobus sp.]
MTDHAGSADSSAAERVKLSVILVAYDMAREIPRSLQSLSPTYQRGVSAHDYEVLVIDNGSPARMDAATVEAFGSRFHYHYLENPPPSPAAALNYGASQAQGEILCFMIDGAHLLTPGVLKLALAAFRAFSEPVVLTRYFFLGPGEQNDTILQGYDQAREDALLQRIGWPEDGYRLFEIGEPLIGGVPKITWFNKMMESNCLFMRRDVFAAIGGADERFDLPGCGFLNMDMCREATELTGTEPVLLVGEGTFHQVHGGTTTNVTPEQRDARVATYRRQYEAIRGRDFRAGEKDVFYLGHLPTLHSKIHLKNRPSQPGQVSQEWKDAVSGKR